MNNNTPVLFVLPTLGTGGSERVVFNLCLHLEPLFFPIVAAFKDGPLRTEMSKKGIHVYVLNRSDGIDWTLIVKLVKIIKKNKIQIVNSHHFVSLFYLFWASRMTGKPLMHTEHSKWEMEDLTPFWNRVFKFFLNRIEMVSAVSSLAYEHLYNVYNVDKERLALVQNGIDLNQFKKNNEKTISRKSLGLKENDIVIGIVGNLRIEKNQQLLIRALALLSKTSKKYKIVLVGNGPCRNDLEELSAELGVTDQSIFAGTRNDVPNIYGIFDMYCLTSHYEGLPLTILEAMASSVPVIGTDVLGIRELISNHKNGILVPDNNPKALAEAVVLLAGDNGRNEEIAENAYKLVSEQYNLKMFVKSYEKIFYHLTLNKK